MHPGLVSGRLVLLYRAKVCRVGRPSINRGVWPLGVVEPYPIVDNAFGLESVLHFVQID